MPTKLCMESRCPHPATYRGRCKGHARTRERQTHPNKHIYNSKRWKLLRRHVLYEEPLCRECGDIATDVDHIKPIEQGGDTWARHNLQSLCALHHSRKTRREQWT